MTGRKRIILAALLSIGLGVAGCGSPERLEQPAVSADGYVYSRFDAGNEVRLHVLQTDPERIDLAAVNDNVARSRITGINGGFFYNGDLLSIAVEDGIPVSGEPNGYGSGWFNAKYARGTLVYDRKDQAMSVQVVSSADELVASDGGYWAQGGVSMSLADDANWRAQALAEAMPFPDDRRLRSGMAFDREGRLYLIVSSTLCTIAEFRDAVVESLGDAGLADGIFLDGDGSSQLSAREEALPGDGRPVVQMVAIKN